MIRLLILVAVVVFFTYLAARGVARLRDRLEDLLSEPVVSRPKIGSELVACAACGVHVPQTRALTGKDDAGNHSGFSAHRFFCSEECQRQGAPPQSLRVRSA